MSSESLKESLLAKIANKDAKVGIIGLGYVGLPLALVFEGKGFAVTGFDVDPKKIEHLEKGHCYIKHLDEKRVMEVSKSDRFTTTTNFDSLAEMDAILICVPTPLTPLP